MVKLGMQRMLHVLLWPGNDRHLCVFNTERKREKKRSRRSRRSSEHTGNLQLKGSSEERRDAGSKHGACYTPTTAIVSIERYFILVLLEPPKNDGCDQQIEG